MKRRKYVSFGNVWLHFVDMKCMLVFGSFCWTAFFRHLVCLNDCNNQSIWFKKRKQIGCIKKKRYGKTLSKWTQRKEFSWWEIFGRRESFFICDETELLVHWLVSRLVLFFVFPLWFPFCTAWRQWAPLFTRNTKRCRPASDGTRVMNELRMMLLACYRLNTIMNCMLTANASNTYCPYL